MNNFFKSFSPLLKKSKKYLIEIILLFMALTITMISLTLYAKNNQNLDKEDIPVKQTYKQDSIYVDVSGAVKKPNLYKVNFGTRIKEAIDKAGGLSDEADVVFFNRNFNLARIVTDQEKIYVPSTSEINNGIFIQNPQVLNYIEPNRSTGIANNTPTEDNNQLISLNSATIEELDQLPGVGQVTANKIIINRPYTTLDDLLTKKVINKGVFEKIKDLISIN